MVFIILHIVHNWYDVVFGCIIGTFTALIAFRQTFASIFDFRFNHILLPRTTSLFHRTVAAGTNVGPYYSYDGFAGSTEMDPFTREGGWGGDQEGYIGAPGDATVLVAGMRTGSLRQAAGPTTGRGLGPSNGMV